MDLQELLDRESIKQLRYSFAWFLETSRPDDLADLFTEDGVVEVGPWGRMDGQDAIRRGYGRAYRHGEQFAAVHAVTNPRIFIDGDTATGTWYLLDCTLNEANVAPLQIVGLYDEDYRKVNGEWRIARLTLKYLWSDHTGKVTDDNPMTMPPRFRRPAPVISE
jgi:ketosteroid isomerase-like protein